MPSRQLALRASRPNQRRRPEAACRASCRHDPVVGRSYDVVIGTEGGKTLERASASDRRLDPIASVRPAVDVLNQALGVRAKIAAETAGSGVHQMGFRSAHRSSGARRK